MKKETPERLLIHVDQDLAKFNKEILRAIFAEVDTMKAMFRDIGIPFNDEAFIKTLNEGSSWLFEILYLQATRMFDKMSDLVKSSMVDKEKLREHVNSIEPISTKIKELLKKIELSADQVPFDEKDNPVITDELKQLFSERSKRYAVGPEIEVYYAVQKFMKVTNELEACLVKNNFGPLFTRYFDFQLPMPNAEIDTFAFPLCLANYDNVLNDGHAVLEFNPDYLEDIAQIKKAKDFTQEMKMSMTPVQSDKTFISGLPADDVSAASFRLPRTVGKLLDEYRANPDKERPQRGRWKNIKG